MSGGTCGRGLLVFRDRSPMKSFTCTKTKICCCCFTFYPSQGGVRMYALGNSRPEGRIWNILYGIWSSPGSVSTFYFFSTRTRDKVTPVETQQLPPPTGHEGPATCRVGWSRSGWQSEVGLLADSEMINPLFSYFPTISSSLDNQ